MITSVDIAQAAKIALKEAITARGLKVESCTDGFTDYGKQRPRFEVVKLIPDDPDVPDGPEHVTFWCQLQCYFESHWSAGSPRATWVALQSRTLPACQIVIELGDPVWVEKVLAVLDYMVDATRHHRVPWDHPVRRYYQSDPSLGS